MCSHTHSGNAGRIKDTFTQAQDLATRVVMVGQLTRHTFNINALQTGGVQQHACCLCARQPPPGIDLGVVGKGAFDAKLGPKPQQQGRNHKEKVHGVKIHG